MALSIEIPPFTVAQSTEIILGMLSRKSAAPDEVEAMNRLSTKLGGLALAIDIVAKQIGISSRFKSVTEYLPYFEQNQSSALKPRDGDPWYSKDLDKFWQAAFDSLSKDASELMSMLCLMRPELVPLSIFQPKDSIHSRAQWEVLEDVERQVQAFGLLFLPYKADLLSNRFQQTVSCLLDSSLVRINAETGVIAVHRLIQES
jgi:hypothetical protein